MSNNETEDLIHNTSDHLVTPCGWQIHQMEALRKQKRQRFIKRGGIAAVVFMIAGLGFWATRAEPTEPATGDAVELTEDALISLRIGAAIRLAEANDRGWRIVEIDGRDQQVQLDLVEGRINFRVVDGIVDAVHIEG